MVQHVGAVVNRVGNTRDGVGRDMNTWVRISQNDEYWIKDSVILCVGGLQNFRGWIVKMVSRLKAREGETLPFSPLPPNKHNGITVTSKAVDIFERLGYCFAFSIGCFVVDFLFLPFYYFWENIVGHGNRTPFWGSRAFNY